MSEAPEHPRPAETDLSATSPAPPSSNLQRAASVFRAAAPFVRRFLPLLDGNIASAVGNLLIQQPRSAPAVNPTRIEERLTDLQTQDRELRDQIAEQNLSLKRAEEGLEAVSGTADRIAMEQRQLREDMQKFGSRVKFVAFVFLALLAVSVLLNLALYLHIEGILR